MRKLAIVFVPLLIVALVIGAVRCGGGESKGSAVIGDTVKVHYTGRLGNGTIFDSSVEREPLQFTLGQGQVIRGFEQAVLGMTVGESKTVVIPADEAYGPYRDELVIVANRSNFPPGWEPEIGDQLPITQPDGREIWVRVVEITESTITIDANHHLAGKDLVFDIELVEIL
jgi:FKBP-type peptidyl-prolyl cis-trans isomerase 2